MSETLFSKLGLIKAVRGWRVEVDKVDSRQLYKMST
jgi:hypothetical protein